MADPFRPHFKALETANKISEVHQSGLAGASKLYREREEKKMGNTEKEKAENDRLLYGKSFIKDGKRINPKDVYLTEIKPVDAGKVHDAFWEAYKTLPDNIRSKFSLCIGRKFANKMYEELIK